MIKAGIILIVVAMLLSLLYVLLAKRLGITDIPNARSSHQHATIRGLGIVMVPFLAFSYFYLGWFNHFLLGSLVLGALVGFADDLLNLRRSLRLFLYLLAVVLMVWSIDVIDLRSNILLTLITIIVTLGTVNTFNFMDGINGLTLAYVLLLLMSSYGLSNEAFLPWEGYLSIASLVLVFLFFNFRKRAIAFIGDAGSISLGILSAFLVLSLIYLERDITYLVLLAVYGVDSVGTIIFRLIKRENIFEPHRLHIYQKMTNELGLGHLLTTGIYIILQAAINGGLYLVIRNSEHVAYWYLLAVLALLTTLYVGIRAYWVRDLNKIKT